MRHHPRILLPLLLASATLTATAGDNEKNISSRITAAKVFLQGAQVTRTANATIPAGNSTIVFTGLSQHLDPQSIQVTGKGSFTILSVNQRMNYLSESPKKKELDELQARMKKLDKDMANENAALAVWGNEEQLLGKNAGVGGQQNGVTLAQLTAVNDYIRERMKAVKAGQLAQQQKLADLQEEKSKLQQQIAQLQALGQRPTSEVVVEVTSPAATTAAFTLNYFAQQAAWVPAYDLRATSAGQPLQLLMKGEVTNNTGEDWDQAELSLSSGNPTLGGVMPTLAPWTIYAWQPRPVAASRMGAAPSAAYAKREADAELSEVVTVRSIASRGPAVDVNRQATTVEYAIATPFTVPSDGQPHTIAVQEHTLPASYTYYATPKLDKNAFLYARTTGWEDLALLSGDANVFFEGTYVGKSYLQLDTPKDTLDISLGRDKGVVVERVKRKASNEKALIGGKRTATIGWDISVRNTKAAAIALDLRDQYPLSPQGEIEVKLTDGGGAEVDKDKGLLTWKLNLAPKETKKAGFAYTVKYPKDMPVVLE